MHLSGRENGWDRSSWCWDLLCYGHESQVHVEACLGAGLHEGQPVLLQTAAASLVGQPRPCSPRGTPWPPTLPRLTLASFSPSSLFTTRSWAESTWHKGLVRPRAQAPPPATLTPLQSQGGEDRLGAHLVPQQHEHHVVLGILLDRS